jgi:AcrR family transcriptional regulator
MGRAPALETVDDSVAPTHARPRGRPRCDASRQAVLRAAYDLLAEGGLRHFTVEGVAARSGVARTTIYRWWPKKGALAMEGLLEATNRDVSFPRTDSAVADTRAQLHLVARLLRGRAGRIICGVIAEGQTDPDTITAFVHDYLEPRRRAFRAILVQGVESGEFRPDLDIPAAVGGLFGPLLFRVLLREPIDEPWVDRLADTVLRGCINPQPHGAAEG